MIAGLLLWPGCSDAMKGGQPKDARAPSADAYAAMIERAHGVEQWESQSAVRANVTVDFGGNRMLDNAGISFDPVVSKARLELQDGSTVVFDGKTAWLTPGDSQMQGPRFHVLSWAYFLAAPFKLDDPGTHLKLLGERRLRGRTYEAAKLTFDSGVGDSPEDWYITYRDPQTGRLHAMAYIVTYGTSQEEAEQSPHAIVFEDYTKVDGVMLSRTWRFYAWSEAEGIHGEPIGEATVSDIAFFEPGEAAFTAPENAREVKVPE